MGSSVILPQPGQPGPLKADEFQSSSIDNVVSFAFRRLSPPSAVYIQRDDTILCGGGTTLGGESIIFTGRFLAAPAPRGGQPGTPPLKRLTVEELLDTAAVVNPFTTRLPGAGSLLVNNAQLSAVALELGEGYLLSLNAVAAVATQRGQTYARAWLRRTGTPGIATSGVLFGDYVTIRNAAGWPYGNLRHPTEGTGSIQSVQQANPGAGADWTFTTPVAQRLRVQSLNAQLLTSATVANRIVRAQIKDAAGNIVWQGPPSAVIAATTTAQVSMSSGQVTSVTDPQTVNIALPSPAFLEAGFTIGTSTTGIQVGDQWSAIWLETEAWVDAA